MIPVPTKPEQKHQLRAISFAILLPLSNILLLAFTDSAFCRPIIITSSLYSILSAKYNSVALSFNFSIFSILLIYSFNALFIISARFLYSSLARISAFSISSSGRLRAISNFITLCLTVYISYIKLYFFFDCHISLSKLFWSPILFYCVCIHGYINKI